MKRDLDFLRQILIRIENLPFASYAAKKDFLDISSDEGKIRYHIELLNDCGYIECSLLGGFGATDFVVKRITNDGCDYLDSVRDQAIWNKTKEKLLTVGSSASLAVVRSIAEGITTATLKSNF